MDSEIAIVWNSLAIPESQQRIFQSDTTVLEKVQRVVGTTFTIGFAAVKNLAAGQLSHLTGYPPVG
nr:hypothetical protein [Mycobacterium leprae]